MAAKFDGKHARANFWVTQQNLAKQKGGRPGYQFNPRKPPRPAKSAVARSTPATPAPEAADATVGATEAASPAADAAAPRS